MLTQERIYQPPSICVPSLDSAKTALERHAQNFLCLHILARRNNVYALKLAMLHPIESHGLDTPRSMQMDESYHVKVPPLELDTPHGLICTEPFSVRVPIPGLSILYFPTQHEYKLEYRLERAYERLQVGTARVSEGQYPAWSYRADRGAFERSRGCEDEVFELLELVACGIDLRLKGVQAWRKEETERYKIQPRLTKVARSAARVAWAKIETSHSENPPI